MRGIGVGDMGGAGKRIREDKNDIMNQVMDSRFGRLFL